MLARFKDTVPDESNHLEMPVQNAEDMLFEPA